MTKILLTLTLLFSFQLNAQEVDYVNLLTAAFKNQKVSSKCPEWKVLNYYQRPGKNKYGVRIEVKFSEKVSRIISVYRIRELIDAQESGVSFSTVAREDLILSASSVFDRISTGDIKVEIGQTYALDDAVQVHADTEDGNTKGSSILIP